MVERVLMADVVVRVELDEERPYLPGERIDGFVFVTAPDVIDCQPLLVRLARSASVSDLSKSEVTRVELLRGELAPGEHQYRFTLEVPSGELPMDLLWHVEAIVGLDWRSDPRHSRELSVRNRAMSPAGLRFDNRLPWWLPVAGLLALVCAPGGVWVASVYDFALRKEEGALWGLIIAALSCVVVGWSARRAWARLLWGNVTLTVHGTPRAGEALSCVLRVSRPVTLKHAIVRLEGISWSRSSTSSNATHWSSSAGMSVKQVGDGTRLDADGTLEVSLGLPKDAPGSFAAPLQGVRWNLSAVLRAPGRPECELGHEVAVSGR